MMLLVLLALAAMIVLLPGSNGRQAEEEFCKVECIGYHARASRGY